MSATAQSVGALIGGTTLIGLAASGQQSFAFITGELVPMKVNNLQFMSRSILKMGYSIVSLPMQSCIYSASRSLGSALQSPKRSFYTQALAGAGKSVKL